MTGVEEWSEILISQAAGGDLPDPAPPTPDEVRERMRLLALPTVDHDAVLATQPDVVRTPQLWHALRSCLVTLFDGPPLQEPNWPDAPAELDAAGRYFYVHLYLLALPRTCDEQRRNGIPDDVVAATLADVGAKLSTYRLGHHTGGFDRQQWAVRHFRGTLHRLGRLQFERLPIDATATGGAPGPDGPADGEPVLSVHIPGDGPLRPADCDASLRAAAEFVAEQFPQERFRFAMCSSWLLDEQLAEYLPREANIVDFQRRFTRFGDRPIADDDVLEFVFHAPRGTADLDRLPQDTALQRAIVRHLRDGRHWRLGHGWTPLVGG